MIPSLLWVLPADVRFKVLVFAGDFSDEQQLSALQELATALERILKKYSRNEDVQHVFDILSISLPGKQDVEYTVLPKIMRLHWTKAFIDQKELQGPLGGTAYPTYGISPNGAVVIVCPDGYVAAVAPLDDAEYVDQYFAGFMNQ